MNKSLASTGRVVARAATAFALTVLLYLAVAMLAGGTFGVGFAELALFVPLVIASYFALVVTDGRRARRQSA